VKVTGGGNWSVSSRDLIRASKCSHCVSISAAVAAGNISVIDAVGGYKDDPSISLIVLQGREWEEIVLASIANSVSNVEFVNIDAEPGDKVLATSNAMGAGVAVIAQALLSTTSESVELVGKPDLLVRSDFHLVEQKAGVVIAERVSSEWTGAYSIWDIKNGSKTKPEYLIQLGQYVEQLGEIGTVSGTGIVHSWGKGVTSVPVDKATSRFQSSFNRLERLLHTKTITEWSTGELHDWGCDERGTCSSIHCEYPRLCAKTWKESGSVVLLPSFGGGNIKKLKQAGFMTVSSVARALETDRPPTIKDKPWGKFRQFAKVMLEENLNGPKVEVTDGYRPTIPAPSPNDLFFDIEWFNPVTSDQALVFMFGVVDAHEDFKVFTTDDFAGELKAFDDFIDFALAGLASSDGHIYHYNNPETVYLKKLSARYGSHRPKDVKFLLSRMVDLMKEAQEAMIPGSGSYSIKKLERYYDADTKLKRDKLVKGGEDAMLNFHLRLEALSVGDVSRANALLDNISRYNRDDCLSTKLLRDWLFGL
jgi:uncharacterized protein